MIMNKRNHMILQLVATMLHPVAATFPIETIDPAWRPMVTILLSTGLGAVQLMLGVKAHNSNPDGTSVEMPYAKKRNERDSSFSFEE